MKNPEVLFSSSLSLLRHGLSPTCVLQQPAVDLVWWQVHVSHHRTTDEDVLDRTEVRVFQFVQDHNVVEFDVEVLVDGLEGAPDGDVVFQLDRDGLLGECLEEAVRGAWLVWIVLVQGDCCVGGSVPEEEHFDV